MRIRILVAVAGADFAWQPGQIVELPEEEARRWCDGVRAVPVAEPVTEPPARPRRRRGGTEVEAAVVEPRETR